MTIASALALLACGASLSGPATAGAASAIVAGTPARAAFLVAGGRVRIEVRFRTSTVGTFTIVGALSDAGSVRASRKLAKGRLQLTEALAGRQGTIRIRDVRPCSRGRGTWQVLSGSGAYEGMTGSGVSRAGPRCAPIAYPVVAVYTGTVRTPAPPSPPPLAQSGPFGGGTSQRKEVLLTVDAGGRTFSGLRFDVDAPCTGPTPLSTARARLSFPEPQAIGADGRFSLTSTVGASTRTVAGRFSKTSVQGTATVSTSVVTAQGTYPCTAGVTWSASQPPPAGVPGRYCGFTLQGPGVCFDVSASGREVTHFESAVVVRCFPGGAPPSEIEVSLTYTGSVRIGGHLGFGSSRLPVEGLISGTASVSGLLDPSGVTASGTVSLGPSTLEYEGMRYNCFPATGRWEARR